MCRKRLKLLVSITCRISFFVDNAFVAGCELDSSSFPCIILVTSLLDD